MPVSTKTAAFAVILGISTCTPKTAPGCQIFNPENFANLGAGDIKDVVLFFSTNLIEKINISRKIKGEKINIFFIGNSSYQKYFLKIPLDKYIFLSHNIITAFDGRSVFYMLHRLLPILLIVICLFFIGINFQTVKREVAYKLHISGDSTTSCCNVDDTLETDGKFDEDPTMAIFNNKIVDYPKTSLANTVRSVASTQDPDSPQVLGTTNAAGEQKWIEVSLSEQKLRAWEGNKIVMEFLISSGKWAPTPVGDFSIWYKTRSQSMIGGSKNLGTYYNLPNVPFNMFFYKGYAVHGAYWHNNFGNPMSHGCVNAPIANSAALFEWTGPVVPPGQNTIRASAQNPGTRVYVHN